MCSWRGSRPVGAALSRRQPVGLEIQIDAHPVSLIVPFYSYGKPHIMMKHVLRLFSVSALLATTVHGLEVASVFTDHMGLPQETPAPVWGTGTPGANITVMFAGQTKSTKTDEKGQWPVRLDPLAASAEPGTLTIRSATGEKSISDVLVGEVRIASGQSNMAANKPGWVRCLGHSATSSKTSSNRTGP